MTTSVISEYARIVGEVLREYRIQREWTRRELQRRVPDVTIQSIGTYETATRNMSVDNLDKIARAMGTSAHALLTQADERMYPVAGGSTLVVNLGTLAASTREEIAPAAKWAAAQIGGLDRTDRTAELTPQALDVLAHVCGLDMPALVSILSWYTEPSPIRCPGCGTPALRTDDTWKHKDGTPVCPPPS